MASYMANLITFIWTSMLLTLACCLVQEQEAKVPGLSVTSLNKDPRKMALTWDNNHNITMSKNVTKTHNSPVMDKNYIKQFCCGFLSCNRNHDLTMYQNTSEKELIFNNMGEEGTAAENFSCFIYKAKFMNCTWAVGPAAPSDVQYYLYSQNSQRKEETECTNYIKDSQKRHVGCHFDELSRFRGKGFFLVTGTSRRVTIKKFCSDKISLFSIERYDSPSNITVNCSKSNCLIQWQKPNTRNKVSPFELKYQLEIQKQGSEDTNNNNQFEIIGSQENEYNFSNYDMGAKYMLKIRTRKNRNGNWGDWSEPIEFGGSEAQEEGSLYLYILVVFGAVFFSFIVIFVFKRYNVMQRLFPRIPQIKDKVNTFDHLDKQVIWEEFKSNPEKCEAIVIIDVTG